MHVGRDATQLRTCLLEGSCQDAERETLALEMWAGRLPPAARRVRGLGGEVSVAPMDPPRMTRAGINLSPSGAAGSVWGCRENKVNSRGCLEWFPPVDSPESLPPAGDTLCRPAGVGRRRGWHRLQAAGGSAAGGAWEPGLQVQSHAATLWLCKDVPLPRFPHLSSESQWKVGWGGASSLRMRPALRGWTGEEGQSLAVLEQCSDMQSAVDLGAFSSPACPRPSPRPPSSRGPPGGLPSSTGEK